MKWLGLSGSLRSESLNTALLREASDLVKPGDTLTPFPLHDIPLFNEDRERPDSVNRLIASIEACDGVLLASPEYNYSVSGVLKNAIDWASRPAYGSCFKGKPTAMVTVSKSPIGGARAQQHLRSILAGMLAPVFPAPEFLVTSAHHQFTDGALTDDVTRKRLTTFLEGFHDFASRFQVPE